MIPVLEEKIMNISLFTEAGGVVGYGHLSRCVAIAQAFMQLGFQPVINMQWPSDHSGLDSLVDDCRSARLDWLDNQRLLSDAAETADVMILDSYKVTAEILETLRGAKALQVFIEDEAGRLPYPPNSVVINTAPIPAGSLPRGDMKSTCLTGPRFHPLRGAFRDVPGRSQQRERIERVFVTMGGGDQVGLAAAVANSLVRAMPQLVVDVVGGQFTPRDTTNPQIHFHADIEDRDMLALMIKADVAVTSSGQIIFECARTGLPVVPIVIAENQLGHARGWVETGFTDLFLKHEDADLFEKIRSALSRLESPQERAKKSRIGQSLVDGQGARRVAKFCLGKAVENKMIIRRAAPGDMEEVFRLSNQETVRRNSFHPNAIVLSEHVNWFNRKLLDDRSLILVAELPGRLIGQVRFDPEGEVTTIGISLDQKFQGIGVGAMLIREGVRRLVAGEPSVSRIVARIKKDNLTSISFFERFGFRLERETVVNGFSALQYAYDVSPLESKAS